MKKITVAIITLAMLSATTLVAKGGGGGQSGGQSQMGTQSKFQEQTKSQEQKKKQERNRHRYEKGSDNAKGGKEGSKKQSRKH